MLFITERAEMILEGNKLFIHAINRGHRYNKPDALFKLSR